MSKSFMLSPSRPKAPSISRELVPCKVEDIPHQALVEYYSIFQSIDNDHSGLVSREELLAAFRVMHVQIEPVRGGVGVGASRMVEGTENGVALSVGTCRRTWRRC